MRNALKAVLCLTALWLAAALDLRPAAAQPSPSPAGLFCYNSGSARWQPCPVAPNLSQPFPGGASLLPPDNLPITASCTTACATTGTQSAFSATISARGSGYTANAIIAFTLSGGTCGVAPIFAVATDLTGAPIGAPQIVNAGSCTTPPTSPVATTCSSCGGGTGLTLNVVYNGSVTNASVAFAVDTTGYQSISISVISGPGGANGASQVSNDPNPANGLTCATATNWSTIIGTFDTQLGQAANASAQGFSYRFPLNARCFRILTNAYSSGTYTLAASLRASPGPLTQVVQATLLNTDPCQNPGTAKSSAAINITSATTTSLVAVSGSTTVYVCGFAVTIAPSGTSADTILFEYGTGAACVGSPTALTGTFGNGDVTTAAPPVAIAYGGAQTIFKSPASNGICALTAGTTVNVQGVLTYVQQ